MKCPICAVDLVISDRQGVEIDYCPRCRGVWLDRGELDKLIDRSASWVQRGDKDDRDDDYERKDHQGYPVRKRRKSLLGELFDFD